MKGFEKSQDNIRKNGRQYFVEYDGENRCIKCCFYYMEKQCKTAKCTPEERKDGKRGYFRDPSPPNKEVYLHKINYRIPD